MNLRWLKHSHSTGGVGDEGVGVVGSGPIRVVGKTQGNTKMANMLSVIKPENE